MGYDRQSSGKIIGTYTKNINCKFDTLKMDKEFLPIKINNVNLEKIFSKDNDFNKALAYCNRHQARFL